MDRRTVLKTCGAGLGLWLGVGLVRLFPLPARPSLLEGAGRIHLMSPEYGLSDRGRASFAVMPTGILLLRHGSLEVHERVTGGSWEGPFESALLGGDLHDIESAAVTLGGALLVTSRGALFQVTSGGEMEKLASLPHFDLTLAPARDLSAVLLFGGETMGNQGIVLRATAGVEGTDWDGGVEILAVLEGHAQAVFDASDGTYVAVGPRIHQVVASRQRLVFELPGAGSRRSRACPDEPERVVSLAMTEDERVLFFSTQDSIHALTGSVAVPVARDLGGVLRYHDGVLFVLDANRGTLMGITDVPRALRVTAAS